MVNRTPNPKTGRSSLLEEYYLSRKAKFCCYSKQVDINSTQYLKVYEICVCEVKFINLSQNCNFKAKFNCHYN